MRKLLAALPVLFVVVASCNQTVVNPVSPDYPCGTKGVVCSGHMCCWQGDVCGGDDPTCPATMCCWVGPDDPTNLGASSPEERKKPRPQFKAYASK